MRDDEWLPEDYTAPLPADEEPASDPWEAVEETDAGEPGSALRHYSLPGSVEKMRKAMADAMNETRESQS